MIFKKKQDAAVQQTAAGEAKPAAKGGKAAAFFRKNWKWMVPVVCVAVLGGWFILRPDKAQNANKDINYVQVSPSKTGCVQHPQRNRHSEPLPIHINVKVAGSGQGVDQQL